MAARIAPLLFAAARAATIDLRTYSAEQSIAQWSSNDQETQLLKDINAAMDSMAKRTDSASSESKLEVQLDGAKTLLRSMTNVGEEGNMINDQRRKVAQLEVSHGTAKQELEKKQDKAETDVQKLATHAECIGKLQDIELKLRVDMVSYDRQSAHCAEGQSDHCDEQFWNALDEVANDAYTLYKTQKTCAPSSREITNVPEPERCQSDTGGTCYFWECHESRHATCNGFSGGHKCVCGTGYCAQGGVCVARPNPLQAPPASLATEEVALSRERATLEHTLHA